MSSRIRYVDFPGQFHEFREESLAAVAAIMERGDFILGEEVKQFEKEFAEYCGSKHAIGVGNGTDALILSLKALGIGPGDEVITVANSWVSSASSIALVGAKPVFVDVASDQTIDPLLIESAINNKTKALMPVHLTGRCARMHEIRAIAKENGLAVIEDAAQAVGAVSQGLRSGSCGTLAAFSLHPLKNLNAAGDAGIITTSDDELAQRIRLLRNHGLSGRNQVELWGYNSRLDNLQAALLIMRLKNLDKVIEQRRAFAKLYVSGLSDLVNCPVERDDERHTYHVFVIQCRKRDELQRFLADRGIETKIHYPVPIHLQRAARELGYKSGDLPVTERQAAEILSLPIHQYLTMDQIGDVITAIREFYKYA